MDENEDTPELEPLFAPLPEDLSTLDDAALAALIESYDLALAEVTADPSQFVTAEFPVGDLLDETRAAYATVRTLRAELASRTAEVPADVPAEDPVVLSDEDIAAFAELGAEASEDDGGDDGDDEPEAPADEAAAEVVAAAPAPAPVPLVPATRPHRSMPRPSASREIRPASVDTSQGRVALVAAAGAPDVMPGTEYASELEIAQAMIKRHSSFGQSAPGTVEKYGIVRAVWEDAYPAERVLGQDIEHNFELVASVVNQKAIKAELARRIKTQGSDIESLQASGGLCAPVTPYYNLQYISTPDRPVMAALPSFNADRGGLRYARPAALSAVTTAVGLITAAEDGAGGSSAQKSCQVIPCPDFQETDVDIIYHCLQFGNLGARTFPELVAQWNNLVLAAHARLAESNLLTQIDAFSTQVTADSLGLGASATLFSQILAAANGMRNRNRMDAEAVLRIMLPWWSVDLIISDIIRTQFQRFDTDRARVIALLRSFNIEPTFYIDGANGRAQVFGSQADGPLDSFPDDVVWYLYPEGSFLYLDGGTLELGIVRDSVLNKTNDFQIFGETFENVAFVGVESLAVVSTVCDNGVVVAPAEGPECPIDYAG